MDYWNPKILAYTGGHRSGKTNPLTTGWSREFADALEKANIWSVQLKVTPKH